MKRSEGITMLACWHFAVAGLFSIGFMVAQGVLALAWNGLFGVSGGELTLLTVLLSGASLLVAASAVLFFIAGWGLWRQRPWARRMAMVLACMELFKFPTGTVIGSLTLWYFLNHNDLRGMPAPVYREVAGAP
ncbi:MAG: hypothetical protein KJ970_15075 [Candidatus Eisenbacteria bacterium]|uniref:Uncharacterized protein n=1 Tax=Eiseniibacteriota bacterium TaxID=2212470 RepID=A0A948WDW9_UNCEI|nr:hypothetical protein [Candidatus Eisenbacteria bacterium]MBU1948350.1 hypothetical protein [Candidatus Eisenbacteria bacterium]MBU2692243.1 hypothetical protein [Candidatus Eisenbacteria bacterium]